MLTLIAQLAPLYLSLSLAIAGSGDAPRGGLVSDVPSGRAEWAPPLMTIIETSRPDVAGQVRIEQRMQIRIVARPGPMPFEVTIDERRSAGPRYIEAKVGKCIASGNFASVAPGSGRRLYLFTRDNRIFSGLLERSCEARDFYSGFYMARAADAKLCVDRDRLLSRAGANCRLKQIRELIEVGD